MWIRTEFHGANTRNAGIGYVLANKEKRNGKSNYFNSWQDEHREEQDSNKIKNTNKVTESACNLFGYKQMSGEVKKIRFDCIKLICNE